MKKLILLVSTVIATMTTQAESFQIMGKVIHADLSVLTELNQQANELFPQDKMMLDIDKDSLTKQFNINPILEKKMEERDFKSKINELKTKISSFLSTGGIVFASADLDPLLKRDLSAFDKIQTLNPLIVLLTRSIVFEAHSYFIKNTSTFSDFQTTAIFLSVIPIVNVFALIKNHEQGGYINGKIHDQNKTYGAFSQCALDSMTEGAVIHDVNCGTSESLQLVPSYRRFTAGAVLIYALMSHQRKMNKMDFMWISLGEGQYLNQALPMAHASTDRGLFIMPGYEFIRQSLDPEKLDSNF